MDVVARRDQHVEIAGIERSPLDELERPVPLGVDLLFLRSAIQADEAPGEVIVDRRLRAGGDDEREERQRPVGGAVEEPLRDPAAHAALENRRLELGGEPRLVGEQFGEGRSDRVARFLRRGSSRNPRLHVRYERPHVGRVEDEFSIGHRRKPPSESIT
jgi:hypothetical protein